MSTMISSSSQSFFTQASQHIALRETNDPFIALAEKIYSELKGQTLATDLQKKETLSTAISAGHLRSLLDKISELYPMLIPPNEKEKSDDERFTVLTVNKREEVILAMSNALHLLATEAIRTHPEKFASRFETEDKFKSLLTIAGRKNEDNLPYLLKALAHDVLICPISYKNMTGENIWAKEHYNSNVGSSFDIDLVAKDGKYKLSSDLYLSKAQRIKQVPLPQQPINIEQMHSMINDSLKPLEKAYFKHVKDLSDRLESLPEVKKRAVLIDLYSKTLNGDSTPNDDALKLKHLLNHPNRFMSLFHQEEIDTSSMNEVNQKLINGISLQLATQELNLDFVIEDNCPELLEQETTAQFSMS